MKKLFFTYVFISLITIVKAQVCTVIISHMISGNQVQYYGSSPDNPATWSWFFNGGSPISSSIQNPIVNYSSAGTFICALTVTGGPNNCIASLSSKTDTVTILPTSVGEIQYEMDDMFVINANPTQIKIENSTAENVTINLIDISGKKVAEIFSGSLMKGTNLFSITAFGITGGYYLVQLVKQSKTITRKVYLNN